VLVRRKVGPLVPLLVSKPSQLLVHIHGLHQLALLKFLLLLLAVAVAVEVAAVLSGVVVH
jgi:hypothetical protein